MTYLEIAATLLRALAFILFYVYLGFGPGFILGLLAANAIFGRGAPTYAQAHKQLIREAAQHNAQWDPTHERWQKEP